MCTDAREFLSANVRYYRNLCGLTQNQLADRAGLTVKTIAKIEAGQAFVSSFSICNIANALEVTPSVLLQSSDEREESNNAEWNIESKFLESLQQLHARNKPLK